AMEWQGYETAAELPWALNPTAGFLASANNPPTKTDTPVSYFFITSERVERLQSLLAAKPKLGLDDLRALQADVVSPASLRLKEGLVHALNDAGLGSTQTAFMAGLRAWDG